MDGLNVGIIDGAKKIRKTLQGITEGLRGKLKDLRAAAPDIATARRDAVASTVRHLVVRAVGGVDHGWCGVDKTPSPASLLAVPDVTTSSTPTAASTASGIASQAQAFLAALRTMVAQRSFLPAIIAATAAARSGALSSAQALAGGEPGRRRLHQPELRSHRRGRSGRGPDRGQGVGLDKKIDRTNDLLRHW